MMVADSPVAPARNLLAHTYLQQSHKERALTDEGVDGLEVAAGPGLQQDGDRTGSIGPGKLEGLAGLGVNDAVGELHSVDGGREGSEDDGGVLHLGGMCKLVKMLKRRKC